MVGWVWVWLGGGGKGVVGGGMGGVQGGVPEAEISTATAQSHPSAPPPPEQPNLGAPHESLGRETAEGQPPPSPIHGPPPPYRLSDLPKLAAQVAAENGGKYRRHNADMVPIGQLDTGPPTPDEERRIAPLPDEAVDPNEFPNLDEVEVEGGT